MLLADTRGIWKDQHFQLSDIFQTEGQIRDKLPGNMPFCQNLLHAFDKHAVSIVLFPVVSEEIPAGFGIVDPHLCRRKLAFQLLFMLFQIFIDLCFKKRVSSVQSLRRALPVKHTVPESSADYRRLPHPQLCFLLRSLDITPLGSVVSAEQNRFLLRADGFQKTNAGRSVRQVVPFLRLCRRPVQKRRTDQKIKLIFCIVEIDTGPPGIGCMKHAENLRTESLLFSKPLHCGPQPRQMAVRTPRFPLSVISKRLRTVVFLRRNLPAGFPAVKIPASPAVARPGPESHRILPDAVNGVILHHTGDELLRMLIGIIAVVTGFVEKSPVDDRSAVLIFCKPVRTFFIPFLFHPTEIHANHYADSISVTRLRQILQHILTVHKAILSPQLCRIREKVDNSSGIYNYAVRIGLFHIIDHFFHIILL